MTEPPQPLGNVAQGHGVPPWEILVVAAPRTGTNFLCECLGEFPEMLGLMEIFNPRGVFGLDSRELLPWFGQRINVAELASVDDPVLVRHFREMPIRALTSLREATASRGLDAFSYKVFPGQLSHEVMARIFAGLHRRVIFLVRNRLDVFISYEKARHLDVWKNHSTKDLLPTIDVEDFVQWAQSVDQWYADVTNLAQLHDKRPVVLTYEDDVDVPKEDLLDRLVDLLGGFGVDVSEMGSMAPKFKKQDSAAEPFAKISNGERVREELEQRTLLTYALTPPLDGETLQRTVG